MSKAIIHLISSWEHCSQILSGFLILAKKEKIDVELIEEPELQKETNNLAAVLVEYENVRIVYDLMDGYQNLEGMKCLLNKCDLYFKRSFSSNYNNRFFSASEINKIHPLGMNYSVFTKKNPYWCGKVFEESKFRRFLRDRINPYFTPERFEMLPTIKKENIRIIFMTRLWDLSITNADELNRNRIRIIRLLKKEYGDSFVGGLCTSELAFKYAPDLVLSSKNTVRYQYLKEMKKADICIGTIGLHQSTSWKTAEYVAASKGIVNERLIYSDSGEFKENINYLPFDSAEECCSQVEKLVSNPNMLYEMKKANNEYYNKYLRPDSLVLNTLKLV